MAYVWRDRASHSDPLNLTDMQEVDPQKFIQYLKLLFENTDQKEHYIKMMDEPVAANANLTVVPKTGTKIITSNRE